MKGILSPLMLVASLALTACASPTGVGTTQPSSSDQVATVVAATLQALSSNTPVGVTPEAPAELLPHTLYYLGNDGVSNIAQVYRLERDGKTITQLTSEPNCKGVDGFDVSLVDGTLAFMADNQLLLVNGDGSNRRVLVEGDRSTENDPCSFENPLSNPVFSPDGQTIAYARGGLNLFDLSTGVSRLAIEDQLSGYGFVVEAHSPVDFSPDGTKLVLQVGQWEAAPAYAIYTLETAALVQASPGGGSFCCGGPTWSPDGSSFFEAIAIGQYAYETGEIWRVDASSGAITALIPFDPNSETMRVPDAPYLAPDGQLYYFFGEYNVDSGYRQAPVLQLVRSAPDGVTDRTVLRDENFVFMNEALWAPDASFVIVATAPARDWLEGGILELYPADGQKSAVWLAPFGQELKWGP